MHTTLVIMAAGMGSRYGGSKQVDGVGPHGEFLMNYGIYDAVRAGFDKVVFIIKPEIRPLIERMAGRDVERLRTPEGKPVEVAYAYQDFAAAVPADFHVPPERVKPLGTCHAVLCTREYVHEPFCVINADDYYGVDAYRTMYEELQKLPARGAATMVGYLLKNTVSEHGTVTRGVCQAEGGYLRSIRETMKIQLFPDGSIADVADGTRHELSGEAVVSMNFWGFMPSIFDELDEYFRAFLREHGTELKAECLLPGLVGALLEEGKLSVSVLSSRDKWFGMTYQEDRPIVADALQKLHESGVYPQTLA